MWASMLLPMWEDWTHSLNLSGEWTTGQDVSAALLPGQDVNKVQPIIWVHVDQTPCLTLLDSGCSCTIVSARLCCTWSKRSVKITIIKGKAWVCCGVGSVWIYIDSSEPAKVNVLVMWKDILSFDLLLRYDAMKALDGVLITWAGTVQFLEASVCAALHIDWPNFRVEFDRRHRIWTASWK